MNKKTLSIGADGKVVVVGRMSYPLAYGFVCPFSREPVALIVKSVSSVFRDMTARGETHFTEGNFSGLIFHKTSETRYVRTGEVALKNDDEDEEYMGVKYYYGLKPEPLMALVQKETSSDEMSPEDFRNRLLAGDLPGYRISKELVRGEDLLVAFLAESAVASQ